MKVALVAALLTALAFPGVARAEAASIVSRDLRVAGVRSLAAARATPRFDLVGLHWRGSGSVRFRTRTVGGRWSGWRLAAPEPEDGPDALGRERTRRGWRVGNPYWTGPSDRIEYRLRGRVLRLRAWLVRSAAAPAPPRALAVAGAPAIIPRSSWGADESVRRGPPSYAPALRFALVHHTAGGNSYTRAQSPAVVRAVYLYHVRGNGWSDVGYNFLVDRYGQVFEGRFGGVTRNVIGAHAAGFNTGSVGVALMGNYTSVQPTAASLDAVTSLLAWRLDLAHVDPLSTVSALSAGNERFSPGAAVLLRAVSGHRDTGSTACPGNFVYRELASAARATAAKGLPKIYAPAVRGALGGPVRFSARLSAPLPWTVTVADAAGTVVATGSGTGSSVGWTWDSGVAAAGRTYRWTMSVPSARSATGTLGGPVVPLPLLSEARAEPPIVSPNSDGRGDSTSISYRLGTTATVTATLVGPTGAVSAVLFTQQQPAGRNTFAFLPDLVLDGEYSVVLTASSAAGRRASASVPVLVSRKLTAFSASPTPFSPNGDRRRDRLSFGVELASPTDVTLRLVRGATEAGVVLATPLAAGAHTFPFDGRTAAGPLADGAYTAVLALADGVAARARLRIDTRAPSLVLRSRWPLRLWLGERARLSVTVDGRKRSLDVAPGSVTVPLGRAPRRVRAVARDEAGNASRSVRFG